MPSGRVHRLNARLFNYDNKVNEFIDLPFAWLGNKHRILFHTPKEAMLIGYMIDGINGAIGGLHHIMLDQIKDKDTKRALELMAILGSKPKKPKGSYVSVDWGNIEKEKAPKLPRGTIIDVDVVPPLKEQMESISKKLIRFIFS